MSPTNRTRRRKWAVSPTGKCTHVVRKAPTIRSPVFAHGYSSNLFQERETPRPHTSLAGYRPPGKKVPARRASTTTTTTASILQSPEGSRRTLPEGGRSRTPPPDWCMEYRVESDQTVRPKSRMDKFSKSAHTFNSLRPFEKPAVGKDRLIRRDLYQSKRPPNNSTWGH